MILILISSLHQQFDAFSNFGSHNVCNVVTLLPIDIVEAEETTRC